MSEPRSDAASETASPVTASPDDAAPASPAGPVAGGPAQPKGAPIWRIGLVFAVLLGGVAWLLLGSQASDAFVYSKLVHEVVGTPDAFAGREIRVEGDLQQGSVRFREDPCEWRFVIEKQGEALPVSFPQCVVPDTFRDDMGISVTVQGAIQPDGSFLANQVVPRCPSKYEMNQRAQQGEAMPHGDVPGDGPNPGGLPGTS